MLEVAFWMLVPCGLGLAAIVCLSVLEKIIVRILKAHGHEVE